MFIRTDTVTMISELHLVEDYLQFDTNFRSIQPILTIFFGKFLKTLNLLFVFIGTNMVMAFSELQLGEVCLQFDYNSQSTEV